jgi:hypothetical protein
MWKENYAFLLYTVSAQLHPDYIFVEFRLLMTPIASLEWMVQIKKEEILIPRCSQMEIDSTQSSKID